MEKSALIHPGQTENSSVSSHLSLATDPLWEERVMNVPRLSLNTLPRKLISNYV